MPGDALFHPHVRDPLHHGGPHLIVQAQRRALGQRIHLSSRVARLRHPRLLRIQKSNPLHRIRMVGVGRVFVGDEGGEGVVVAVLQGGRELPGPGLEVPGQGGPVHAAVVPPALDGPLPAAPGPLHPAPHMPVMRLVPAALGKILALAPPHGVRRAVPHDLHDLPALPGVVLVLRGALLPVEELALRTGAAAHGGEMIAVEVVLLVLLVFVGGAPRLVADDSHPCTCDQNPRARDPSHRSSHHDRSN
mmetsp:Transcript_61301/g.164279  ORF Transcript_61301/g.164279 Transcript_61301/m.164279 type:complete len:247 (+) Transcript_61301:447-1187(+)